MSQDKRRSRPSIRPTIKAFSRSFFQTKSARKKQQEIEELHSEYMRLSGAVKEADDEELAWRFLYYNVSGDARGSGLGDWVEDEKNNHVRIQEALGVLNRTHGDIYGRRKIVARNEEQVVMKPDAFGSAFTIFKNQQFEPRLRAGFDERDSLLIGIEQMAEEHNRCREELKKFKATDGFIRLRAHERSITLAAYNQLLAKAKGQKQEAQKAIEGFHSFERELVRRKRIEFRKEEKQPLRALEDHLESSKKKSKVGHKLTQEELELRCGELQAMIEGL